MGFYRVLASIAFMFGCAIWWNEPQRATALFGMAIYLLVSGIAEKLLKPSPERPLVEAERP